MQQQLLILKTKQSLELKNVKSKSLLTDKKSFIIGSLVAILIAISPYFFYAYESVPDQKVWNTLIFSYKSAYYESARTAMWTFSGKAIPLFFLIMWFFTCRHWWHHALIIPIAMYVFQFILVVNDDLNYIDDSVLIYLIPIMAIIIPSIYLVRARIFNKINTVGKTTQELEDELMLKPATFWGKVRQFF